MVEVGVTWWSAPLWAVSVGLAGLLGYVVLVRGRLLVRATLAAALAAALPWALGQALLVGVRDPSVAEVLARVVVCAMSLLGPAMLLALLAISGTLEGRGRVAAAAAALGAITGAVTVNTDWIVEGVWTTPLGFYYPRAGPVNLIVGLEFVVCVALGIAFSTTGVRRQASPRLRALTGRLRGVAAISLVGVSDVLLAHRIGVFPLGVVSAAIALAVTAHVVGRDILPPRGLDRTAAAQLGVAAALGAIAGLALLAGRGAAGGLALPWVVAVVVPTLLAAESSASVLGDRAHRRWLERARRADRALEEFAERSFDASGERELAGAIAELGTRYLGMSRVQLLLEHPGGGWRSVEPADDGDEDAPREVVREVDGRVRAWLAGGDGPVLAEDLSGARLGELRAPIEDLMRELEAEILVPLVDRERLLGVIAASPAAGRGGLGDEDRTALSRVEQAASRALTHIELVREATERVGTAREVEVASAVQQARAPGRLELWLTGVQVTSYYHAAPDFGGDWWTAHELDDGRTLVAIGDVNGRGMPAALVSATVAGACEAAQSVLGRELTIAALVTLLNRAVLDVGRGRYAMSCFLALFDPRAGSVAFADAGHPFPYVCRQPDGGDLELRSLVARGTPFGLEEDPPIEVHDFAIRPGDALVLYTDTLVEAAPAAGASRYGNRRLRRILRAAPADAHLCDAIVDDVLGYCQGRPLGDDMTVLVARVIDAGGADEA